MKIRLLKRFSAITLVFVLSCIVVTSSWAVSANTSEQVVDKQQLTMEQLRSQNKQLQQRQRFTTGGLAMVMGIAALLVFLVYSSRWSRQLEIKNRQLQRERNVVVSQNKQLAIERDRAEMASKAKTAFIQSMTHEIRTPLNQISGFTQVLTMTDAKLEREERHSLNQHIMDSVRHLTTILDDLILISDLESRSTAQDEEECYPWLIASQVVEGVRASVSQGVVLDNRCNVSRSLSLYTQPALINKALTELLDNAAKFTREGSITLITELNDHDLCFSVQDTGTGIPADKAEFVFGRFAKLDSFSQGAGLGLSVARLIAERLGGSLKLDTSYTLGAKFDLIVKV